MLPQWNKSQFVSALNTGKMTEDNTVEVREEFLGFVEAESTKGVALAEKFMTTQAEFGIETREMCAQGYDGAANLDGVHGGVQAIIRQHVPEAVYVHCKAHSLNLAIGHACKEPLVRNMLSTLQTICICIRLFSQATASLSRIFTSRCFSKRRDGETCKAKNLVRNTMGKSG